MIHGVRRVLALACAADLWAAARAFVSLRLRVGPEFSACGYPALAAVLLAIVPLSSCGNRNAAASSPPPEPRVSRPARPPQPPAGPVSEPQIVTSLPSPQPVPPEAVPDTPGPLVVPPEPEISPQSEPSPRRPVASAPPVTSETPAQPEAPAAPVPQLGQMLSQDQRQKYSQLIEQAIKRAQERLEVVVANPSRLNEEQRATIKRVRAFIRQAEDAKAQDLTIAKNLADRALLLAEDLAKNFK